MQFYRIYFASTALTDFLLTTLPIALGIALNAAAPRTITVISPVVAKAAAVLFVGVIAGAIGSNWHVVTDNIARLGLGLFKLVAALSVIGFGVSRWLGSSDQEAKTISIETGVQNGALALATAAPLVADGPPFNAYAIPAAIFSVVWLTTALLGFLLLARSS